MNESTSGIKELVKTFTILDGEEIVLKLFKSFTVVKDFLVTCRIKALGCRYSNDRGRNLL